MADRFVVERLFSLPYFQKTFDQMFKPTVEAMMTKLLSNINGLDVALFNKASEEIHKFVHNGMKRVMMDHYCEYFTDDDINFFSEVHQHPAMLKAQEAIPAYVMKAMSWLDENAEVIDKAIDQVIEEVV